MLALIFTAIIRKETVVFDNTRLSYLKEEGRSGLSLLHFSSHLSDTNRKGIILRLTFYVVMKRKNIVCCQSFNKTNEPCVTERGSWKSIMEVVGTMPTGHTGARRSGAHAKSANLLNPTF